MKRLQYNFYIFNPFLKNIELKEYLELIFSIKINEKMNKILNRNLTFY